VFKSKSKVALSILTLVAVCGVSIYAWAHVSTRKHYHTITGGAVYTSSQGTITMLHADVISTIEDTNDGFFNLRGTTDDTQTANCTFAETSEDTPKPAICSWPNPGILCTRIKVGDCKGGIRSSFASCTTPNAGCTGTVFVQLLDGSGTVPPIIIVKDPAIGTDPKICNEEFPKTADLPRGEMTRVDQVCNSKLAWSAEDTVLREAWRTDLSLNRDQPRFFSRGTWSAAFDATCNPADGVPSGSCKQSGVINITFPVSAANACSAANWRCGQRANGEFGPNARDCDFDTSSGQCTCTCPRCDEVSTFVNLGFPPSGGTPGTGHYTISNLNAKETAACRVTVRGTTE
jgi:hypothetical protein